jgi:hypothetical protein
MDSGSLVELFIALMIRIQSFALFWLQFSARRPNVNIYSFMKLLSFIEGLTVFYPSINTPERDLHAAVPTED